DLGHELGGPLAGAVLQLVMEILELGNQIGGEHEDREADGRVPDRNPDRRVTGSEKEVASDPIERAENAEAERNWTAEIPGRDPDRKQVDGGKGRIDPGKVVDNANQARETEKDR